DRATADLVDDEPHLTRRLADGSLNRPSLHRLLLRRLSGFGLRGLALCRRTLRAVPTEQPRRRELAELVAHHVFGDVHWDELVPVVLRQGVAQDVGRYRRTLIPCLD